MVNHKVCHPQQRLVTIDIYARFEVTLRVHLHESFKEVPLEQTFPTNTKTTLRDIVNPILPQARTFIFLIGMLGASLALSSPGKSNSSVLPLRRNTRDRIGDFLM
jgi:hypothetical protein